MASPKVIVTLALLISTQNTFGQNKDIEGLQKTIKFISGQNPATKRDFIWTTCNNGNLFYAGDTVTFYNQEYSYLNKKCLTYLNCRFSDQYSIKITYSGLVYSSKQKKKGNTDDLDPTNLPFPDSLVNFNDSSSLSAEYILKNKNTVINIYKRSSVLYTLRLLSFKEMTNPKDKSKYYSLKFIKDKFG